MNEKSVEMQLKNLILSKYGSIREFSIKISMPYSTIDSIIKRGVENAGINNILKICNELDISADDLANGKIVNKSMRGKSEDDLDIFSIPGILSMPDMKKVPRLGTISCGKPVLAVEEADEFDEAPIDLDCDFTLTCKGDSMVNARIFDGDIVYVRSQSDVENGQIAVVLIDDEALLKRVYKQPEQLILSPENTAHQPIVISGPQLNEVRILGLAVWFRSKVR